MYNEDGVTESKNNIFGCAIFTILIVVLILILTSLNPFFVLELSFGIFIITLLIMEFNMLGVFTKYIKNTVSTTGSNMMDLLAAFDPEGASEAQIAQMDDMLTEITKQKIRAEVDFKREKKEVDIINENYTKRVAAAERIKDKMDNELDSSRKADYAEALEELMTEIEKMVPELDREAQEAKDAEAYFHELEIAVKNASEKLKNARKTLLDARKRVERAEQRVARESEKEEQAKILAGIQKNVNTGSAALDAMTRRAEALEEKAAVSREKSALLQPATTKNSIIEDELKNVSVNSETTKESFEDRLARLKNKNN